MISGKEVPVKIGTFTDGNETNGCTSLCKSVVCYERVILDTFFGHSCGHLQGGALRRMDMSGYCKKFMTKCTDAEH